MPQVYARSERPADRAVDAQMLFSQLVALIDQQDGRSAAAPHAAYWQHDGKSEEPLMLMSVEVDGTRYALVCAQARLAEVSLSPREMEIVRLVATGHANKTIADILDISQWTVSTHIRRIFAKLGVSSRAEMVAKAIDLRLVK